MTDKLIIVESPAKANTIKKFLGGNTKVVASMGHIRDLPKSKLGINIENNFEPEYINIRGKGDLIKELKTDAKNAKKVYLATDPDREGEAIAWHLSNVLNVDAKKVTRVTFNEITKTAVQKAIKEPRDIDINLVDAQQARRVLDRIVGYKISPVLWKKVKRGLSAGRVQSVAVKLIVDREEEIEKFIPEEYWNIYAELLDEKTNKKFEAKFYGKAGKKQEIHSKEEVDKILFAIKKATYIVEDVKKSEKKRTPAPPFTTSTMQQEASRKIGFSIKKTMSVAQGLYEGVKIQDKGTVGLITYMRTDSTRISEEARATAKTYITETYGKDYYENRYYKTNKEAQDAHEGIRPTYAELEPEKIKDSLTKDQYKLYKLIYNRFMASQMVSAIYDTMSVTINANDYTFKANGQNLKFKGFMTLYVEGTDEKEEKEAGMLPELIPNEIVKLEKIEPKQSFTEPPARYTEASLVKTLEEKGIGRPSTYSPTITTILERRYIEKEQKQLVPTELGKIVNKLLCENFADVINVEFTAKVETEFDNIAEGQEDWKKMIGEFYGPFEENVERVAEMVKICHAMGVTVEAELGHVGDNAGAGKLENPEDYYTDPDTALDYITRTGADSLAVAVGNAHGDYAFPPKLDFDRIDVISKKVNIPLVLHGGSGLADNDFRQAVQLGVSKVNIFTDIDKAGKAGVEAGIAAGERTMMGLIAYEIDAMKKVVAEKIRLFGSEGKAC